MATKRAFTEKDLKEDFKLFVWYLWTQILFLPRPTKRQLEVCEYLSNDEDYGNTKMIQAFRGIGKSWITCAYAAWSLWRNPNEKIIVVSGTGRLAADFMMFVKRIITETPCLSHMVPERNDHRHRWSNEKLDVVGCRLTKQASLTCLGMTSQLQGMRATLIIGDDIETMENSYTQDGRDKLMAKISDMFTVLVPEGARVIFLGTPQSQESIYNKVTDRGFHKAIWPALIPEEVEQYRGCLYWKLHDEILGGKVYPGEATDPQRFNEEYLEKKRIEMGASAFQLQYMMDTTLSDLDRFPLKLSDLIVAPLGITEAPSPLIWGTKNPSRFINVGFQGDRFYSPAYTPNDTRLVKYSDKILAVDPSGRGKDETGVSVVGQCMDKLCLLHNEGLRGGYQESLMEIAELAKRFQVNMVVVESNFGDGLYSELLKPLLASIYPCQVEEVRNNKQKELRIIHTLEPIMNQHRLVISEDVIKRDLKEPELEYSLFYQLTRITHQRGALRHDDRLDSLEIACRYFTERLAIDSKRAHQKYLEDERRALLEKFVKDSNRVLSGSGQSRKNTHSIINHYL